MKIGDTLREVFVKNPSKKEPKSHYEVVVGDIGIVYKGHSKKDAIVEYKQYKHHVKGLTNRPRPKVVMMKDGLILKMNPYRDTREAEQVRKDKKIKRKKTRGPSVAGLTGKSFEPLERMFANPRLSGDNLKKCLKVSHFLAGKKLSWVRIRKGNITVTMFRAIPTNPPFYISGDMDKYIRVGVSGTVFMDKIFKVEYDADLQSADFYIA